MIENYYINKLKYELKGENKSLLYRLNELFNLLIQFLRKLLQRGNDYAKNMSLILEMLLKYQEVLLNRMNYSIMPTPPIYYKEKVRNYDEKRIW